MDEVGHFFDDFMNGNDAGGGGGLGGIQTMGMLNALRTGDPRVDMVLAMCFPFILKVGMDMVRRVLAKIRQFWVRPLTNTEYHERRIVHTTNHDRWGGSDNGEDTQNTVLIKAIDMYLHSQVKLELKQADLDLTSTEDKNASVGRRNHYYYHHDDNDESSKTMAGTLSKYKIVHRPPVNDWHSLGEYGSGEHVGEVSLQIQRLDLDASGNQTNSSGGGGASGSTVKTYLFTSTSGPAIDAFVDTAYQWYIEELKKLDDNSRYLYELKAVKKEEDEESPGRVYTRYRLSDEKTFDSLFFRQKESLLKLIRHFTDRSGKFKIQGFPHKLGILLSGPPGSGKTSFIKALAHHTKRSIVNVPLARIKTNAELMSVFFNHRKHVEGEHMPAKVGFKDAIFVLEDVDAASDVVKRRDGGLGSTDDGDSGNHCCPADIQLLESDLPRPKSVWQMLLDSNDSSCQELVKLLIEKSARLKEEAAKPDILTGTLKRMRSLPGLGLVGADVLTDTDQDHPIEKIGADALRLAEKQMSDSRAVSQYLSDQSRLLKTRIDQGAEIDDNFIDNLLGKDNFGDVFRDVKLGGSKMKAQASVATGVAGTGTPPRAGAVTPVTLPSSSTHLSRTMELSQKANPSTMTPTTVQGFGTDGGMNSFWKKPDELNLSGLLNVLDGVVDSPGRMIVITSNHVEQLDPALIRPGRIDKKLFLGYMDATNVVQMLQHYFQIQLSNSQKHRVQRVMNGHDECRPLSLTPAQIEQMTAEYDDIEDMLEALEMKGRSLVSKRMKIRY